MIRKKLYLKYFSVYFLVTIIVFGVSILFSLLVVRRQYGDWTRNAVGSMGIRVLEAIRGDLKTANTNGIERLFVQTAEISGIDLTLIDRERGVYASSIAPGDIPNECLYSVQVAEMFTGKVAGDEPLRVATADSGDHLILPLRQAGIVNHILILSPAEFDNIDFTRQLTNIMLLIIAVAVIVALAGSLVMAKSLLEPVGNILDVVSEVAKGDFETKIRMETNDEFGVIGESINDMIDQIRYLFDQLTAEKEEFHGIVSSLREALWVIDDRDRIVFANETFKKLVKRDDLDGVAYWQALRLHELDLIVQKTKDTRDRVVEEIEYEGNIFIASAQYIATKAEIIILFHDISQIRIAEEIKKNIVSSVSHELRTPLTSILGYLETLIVDEKDDTKRKYLEVIERNARRMFHLTKDLLELSALESSDGGLEVAKIDVVVLADSMKRLFEKRFSEKNLSFAVTVEKSAKLRGDVYKIEQMLVNLIDNALKYTETGGVKVGFRSEDGFAVIEVSDTGIGIAGKHQSQVFERFYVVDKSRSRAEGGTGLGLSIVQRIVELHKGAVELKSGLGQGTTFIVKIPVG